MYDIHAALEELGAAMRRGRPRKRMWIQTSQGPVCFIDPAPSFGPGLEYGVSGSVRMSPRYCTAFKAIP